MSYRLSVLIPARNEYYYDIDLLYETVQNVLTNTSEQCEIVVCLDGYWPNQPLPSHPRLRVIHHNQSIGQRAATNEAARIATGEWVCKLDAHCAVGPDFDTRLLEGAQPHWTIVPGQYNLQVFEWKCKKCSWTKDQSPKPSKCEKCGSRYLKQVKIWQPRDGKEGRRRAYTHSWRFDSTLTFQYWGAYAADEAHHQKHKTQLRPETQQPIHDTMCLLGACWVIRRQRYFDLNICDEDFGSWGNQGVEVAMKTWLSGGELKVNQSTWFAHFFRVGGINFPYSDGGRKERAVARSKELFLNNKWNKQIYPLSWLIEKFKPVPDWHTNNNPVLAQVIEAGKTFKSPVLPLVLDHARTANPEGRSIGKDGFFDGKQVTPDAVGLSTVNRRDSVGPAQVVNLHNRLNVERVTTGSVLANNVVQNRDSGSVAHRERRNQPSVHQSVQSEALVVADPVPEGLQSDLFVSVLIQAANPDPAAVRSDFNISKESGDFSESQVVNREILQVSHDSASIAELGLGPESRVQRDSGPSIITRNQPRKTCLYYTCNSHDPLLEQAARANLKRATNGHEIGCVALQRTDFGDWTIVLDREKSGGTMHYQILAGLERSTADYVFLCESDVFYHPSHFEFTPPRDDTFYYNTNVWRVRWEDGHAVRTANLQQVSGICASRELLLSHYRKRVEIIEKNGGRFDVKSMAYEPGTRGRFGNERVENWESPYPNLDITGHGNTLTVPHFSVESFRNKKHAAGWEENDGQISGWPIIYGRVQEWLKELADS